MPVNSGLLSRQNRRSIAGSRRFRSPGASRPETAMQAAFLRALARAVTRHHAGPITIPTGSVTITKITQVLAALERARCNGSQGNG
jgi:hypothetical protein